MHDFRGRDAPRSDVRKPGTREGGCFRCSRGAGKSISQFGRQEEEGFPLTVFLSPLGLQRVGRGPPHPPPPGRESHVLCAVHRFTRESHPRNPRRNTQGSVWPSTWASRGPAKITVQSPITEALGEVQPQGPSPGNGAGGREEAAILPHLSTGAAVGGRESRVSAAGLLAPSGAASERRSGSLGFSAVHSVRCAAVLHLSENVPWAQRRHATAVARPGPLDVGRRVSVPCLCWLEVPFSPWLRAGRGAQLHTPSSLSVYGRVGRVRPALCPSATSPRALLLEDARAVSSDYPGGRSSPRPADL